MPGFPDFQLPDGAARMTVFGDDDSVQNPSSQLVPGGFRHGPCGLSDRDKVYPLRQICVLKRRPDGGIRKDTSDCFTDDLICVVSQVQFTLPPLPVHGCMLLSLLAGSGRTLSVMQPALRAYFQQRF